MNFLQYVKTFHCRIMYRQIDATNNTTMLLHIWLKKADRGSSNNSDNCCYHNWYCNDFKIRNSSIVRWFIIGLSGPVVFAAGSAISILWFPPDQHTTAMAITTIAGFAGAAGCFI